MFFGTTAMKALAGAWAGLLNSAHTIAATVSGAGTSSQANATGLTNTINIVTTNAANAGVRLPVPTGPNDVMVVIADAGIAASTVVYPASGGKLNGLAANAGITLAAGKVLVCLSRNNADWVAILSA